VAGEGAAPAGAGGARGVEIRWAQALQDDLRVSAML
jgi:hypothetical protein